MFDQYRAKKNEKTECEKSVAAQKALLRDTVTVRKNYEMVLNVKLESEDNVEIMSEQKTGRAVKRKSDWQSREE